MRERNNGGGVVRLAGFGDIGSLEVDLDSVGGGARYRLVAWSVRREPIIAIANAGGDRQWIGKLRLEVPNLRLDLSHPVAVGRRQEVRFALFTFAIDNIWLASSFCPGVRSSSGVLTATWTSSGNVLSFFSKACFRYRSFESRISVFNGFSLSFDLVLLRLCSARTSAGTNG